MTCSKMPYLQIKTHHSVLFQLGIFLAFTLLSSGVIADHHKEPNELSGLQSWNDDSSPNSFGDFQDEDIPVILTTTRLRQSRSEAPGSITLISRQMILNSGARSIPELLRFVPGMSVAKYYGHTYAVSYHGTQFNDVKRMQVLIDGHSVYDSALAKVDWETLPIALQDIARIEVARGPNTATHGANAFLGVINIITLNAGEGDKALLEARRGSYNVQDLYARSRHTINDHLLSVSLLRNKDDGFDKKPQVFARNDNKDRRIASLNWDYQPDSMLQLHSRLAISETERSSDIDRALNMQSTPLRESQNIFLLSNLNYQLNSKQEIATKFNFRSNKSDRNFDACGPAIFASPVLRNYYLQFPAEARALVVAAATGQPPPIPSDSAAQALMTQVLAENTRLNNLGISNICGDLNEDYHEYIANIEVSHTWAVNQRFRTLWGVNLRHDQISSETFFKQKKQRFSYQVFNSSEFKLTPYVIFNAGLMYEDGEYVDTILTPRLALNTRLNNHHNLRLVYATAIRKPALFETHAQWSYRINNVRPEGVFGDNSRVEFYELAFGNPSLKNEKIISYEAGLHSHWPTYGIELDLRLFSDELEKLISERPILGNFKPSNTNQARQKGAELELNYHLSTLTQFRLNYAYIDSDVSIDIEKQFTPTHNLTLFASHQINTRWAINSAYISYRKISKNHYRRFDTGLSYNIPLHDQYRLKTSLKVQHRMDQSYETRTDNLYKHDTHVYLSLALSF